MATSIGIMDSAYFVGRNEILSWINKRLQLNLSRIEEVINIALLFTPHPLISFLKTENVHVLIDTMTLSFF